MTAVTMGAATTTMRPAIAGVAPVFPSDWAVFGALPNYEACMTAHQHGGMQGPIALPCWYNTARST